MVRLPLGSAQDGLSQLVKMKKPSLYDMCVRDDRLLSVSSDDVTLEEGMEIIKHLRSCLTPDAVGLAAPQVGIFKNVCVIEIASDRFGGPFSLDLVNPKIVEKSDKMVDHVERCFSVGKTAEYKVQRHESVVIEDEVNGRTELDGFRGYVTQHEIDHLNGTTIKTKGTPTRNVPITNAYPKIGRNEACPCGSEQKYKKCCLGTI